tara:strand:+ start:175 stop:879 length:705 start_codon:yes stop_codon:yes gene_type:complete
MINKFKQILGMAKEKTPTIDQEGYDGALDENFDGREEITEEKLNELVDTTFIETTSEAVGFENRESQWNAYRIISQYINPEGSVLDFGCGRGEFKSFFLDEFSYDLDYTGIDMNKQLIDAGLKINPGYNLLQTDWTKYDGNADWCISVGSHDVRYDANLKLSDKEYLLETIKKMYNCAKEGVVIMLASDILRQDEGIITWNAGELLNDILKEFRTAIVDHSFSDALFTLIIYKN